MPDSDLVSIGGGDTPASPCDFSTIKAHLRRFRDGKEKQLQQARCLGQRVCAQQMVLEERIKRIQDLMEDDGDEEEVRERYKQLVDTQLGWEEENASLFNAFGSGAKRCTPHSSSSRDYGPLPRKEPERTKPVVGTAATVSSSSAAQSRRANIELALEIGNGLLTEVRRLSRLLGEREKTIQDMKEERDDPERIIESLRTTIRENDKTIDELRSINWDLEVTLRSLQSKLSDSQSSNHRLESEIKRLSDQLATDSGASENSKTECDTSRNTTDGPKPDELETSPAVGCDWEWL